MIGLETDDVSGDDEADERRTAAVSERVMTAGRGRAGAGCASGMPSSCADCSTCTISRSTAACISTVVQLIKSLHDPLEVGTIYRGSMMMSANKAWNINVLDTD